MISSKNILPIIALLLCSLASTSTAQAPATCASKLINCQTYLNSTSPPAASCCQPLKDAVTNELPCLCAIFNDPTIIKAFNIDLNAALQLPARCGMQSLASTNACGKSAAGAPGSLPFPPPPPATPGDNTNAANGRTWIGLWSLLSVMLFWYSIFA